MHRSVRTSSLAIVMRSPVVMPTSAQLVAGGCAALVSLIVFVLTAAPDLTVANYSGDGGELIAASATLGIPHPPGYPTYVLIGKLFSLLPVGTVAFRFALLSALSMAIAAGFVAMAVAKQLQDSKGTVTVSQMAAATSAGLMFAFMSLTWGQATVVEVYALNLAFVAAFVWAATSQRQPRLVGFLLGLSITTHLTSLLLIPMALMLVAKRNWLRMFQGVGVGLLPLAALPMLATRGSPMMWGQAHEIRGWLWLISAKLYSPNVMALPLAGLPGRIGLWSATSPSLFLTLAAAFLAGLHYVRHRARRRLVLALLGTLLVYTLFALGYRTDDAVLQLLPGLLLSIVLLGLLFSRFGWLLLIVPLALLAVNYRSHRSTTTPPVRQKAEALFAQVPIDALLITPGDQTIAILSYFHIVEGHRNDLTLVDANLFQFDWYRQHLASRETNLRVPVDDDLLGFIVLNQTLRPVCTISLVDQTAHKCRSPDEELTHLHR